MKIIPFEESYRDDLIFMILQAKDALGRKPGLNEDLLDIKSNYFDKGGRFWIAIDGNDRVIGSIGYVRVDGTNEAFIHRLFVKVAEKRKGIGSALLKIAEEDMKLRGPGDLEGTAQSGMPFDLKIANILRDNDLMEEARHVAEKILEEDPKENLPQNTVIWQQLQLLKKNKANFSEIS